MITTSIDSDVYSSICLFTNNNLFSDLIINRGYILRNSEKSSDPRALKAWTEVVIADELDDHIFYPKNLNNI